MKQQACSTSKRFQSLAVAVIFFIVFLGLVQFIADSRHSADPTETIGANDFIAYWAAFVLARNDEDPYASEKLYAIQKHLFPALDQARQYWNPPWILTLLSPVLALPFEYARAVWFLLNTLFLTISGVLLWRIVSPLRFDFRWCLLATATFVPAWQAIRIGQLSMLAVFGLCSFLWFLKQQKPLFAGLMLVLASCKPHPFYLTLLLIFVEMLRAGQYRLLCTCFFAYLFLILATASFLPSSFTFWQPGVVVPLHWKTATLATYLRLFAAQQTGRVPVWPVIASPLFGFCLFFLGYALTKPRRLTFDAIVLTLVLSLITAPYAWVFDYAVLLTVQVSLVAAVCCSAAPRKRTTEILAWFVLIHLTALVLSHISESMHVEIWFPAAIFGVWLRAKRLLCAGDYDTFRTSLSA